jgi:anti-sigma regulatory factor (Ser/Thr protein kinase)
MQQYVTLTLPMIHDIEVTASKSASAMGELIGMSRDKIDEVQLAVIEACINAVEYSGASEVRIRLIVLGAEKTPEGLQVTVEDSGRGFELDAVKAKKRDDNRGHGLKIIHGLMDKVEILSDTNGTKVIMTKFC